MNVEQQFREELDRVTPNLGSPDWADVLGRASQYSATARRRTAAFAAAVVAAAVLAVATPLGSAIATGVGDFSAWLTGQPGEPVSEAEQQAFDEVNARSWLGFPKGTQLRRLATAEAAGAKVELLGFRSGETLCLRLVSSGDARGSTQSCAPLRELRSAGEPVRVILADHSFGRGTKRAWYGVFRYTSPLVQVTAGIAADGVESVTVEDESGRHTVRAVSNAFLYVAAKPDIGQRVRSISARTEAGSVAIPFAPAPFGTGGGAATPKTTVPGPAKVDREVTTGQIGWLERHEPRGEPLDVIPARTRRHILPNLIFGRVISPSNEGPLRVAVTLNADRGAPHVPAGICTWLVMRGGAGGGCSRRDQIFSRGPLTLSVSLAGGSDAFATAVGLASDDVDKLVVFSARGEEFAVPLVDNVFAVSLARAKLPARLVAYDDGGAVIGLTDPIGDLAGASVGPTAEKATSLLKVASPLGSTAELLVSPSTAGGECMFIRYKGKSATGTMSGCSSGAWRGEPLQLNTYGNPGEFVMGRVRPDLTRVQIGYADGAKTVVTPTRGYVLYEIPAEHIELGKEAVTATGFDQNGKRVATWSFRPPKGP
jgi:hypothetical protein